MKKSVIILLHIGFWVCYFILIAIMLAVYYRSNLSAGNQESRILNALKTLFLFAFIPSATSYWCYYLILFPRYLQHKNIFLSIIQGLLISAGAAIIGYILIRYSIESGYLIDMDKGGIHGRSTALIAIAAMTIIGVVSGVVALVIKGFINWLNEKKLKDALKEKNHEMEIALIKSKLDPHLLFNTINNGKAPEYKAWKDTYNLKPRSTIKIAWMPDNRPGKWMYHCHIIEHHAAGMMANFEVIDPLNPATEKQD